MKIDTRLRLIDLHDASKIDIPALAREAERQIAIKMTEEAQRERTQWARERYGQQLIPCS